MTEAATKVTFELATPDRLWLSVEADMVVVPGREGDFGVLPGHAPLISSIRPGVIDVHQGDQISDRIFVADGFADVANSRCTVLAGEAMHLSDVDRSAAEKRLKDAEQALAQAADDAKAHAESAVAVAEALVAALR